jgi:hypothetical protein
MRIDIGGLTRLGLVSVKLLKEAKAVTPATPSSRVTA